MIELRPDLQPKRRRAHPEDDLCVEIWKALQYLLPPTVLAFHVPNGGKRNKREAGRLKAMGVVPGVGDYEFVWISGNALCLGFIEIKIGKGRQSADQIAFERKAAAIGIPYAIARSLDEVIDTLQGWRCPMRGNWDDLRGMALGADQHIDAVS